MKFVTVLIFSVSAALLGCKALDSEPLPLNSLDSKSVVKIPGNASRELAVSLVSLTDTRCPQNVICVQDGRVDMTLFVKDQTDSVMVETVFRGSGEKNSGKIFDLGGYRYALYVERVLPYPKEGKKPKLEDYLIDFRINNQ